MCGRFSSTFSFRDIKVGWNLYGDLDFAPRYNIAPSQEVPVVVKTDRGNEAKLMKWGLVPSWASDPSIGNTMINARAETLLDKPSFKQLVSTRRCVIPADGFYGWRREGNGKIPVWIHFKNRKPFAFAGLWDEWRDAKSGNTLNTFTIITTEPNALVRPIHSRMPVIYDRAMSHQWLERNAYLPKNLTAALGPWPSEDMEAWDVSTIVNSPDNDSAACVPPAPPGESKSGQFIAALKQKRDQQFFDASVFGLQFRSVGDIANLSHNNVHANQCVRSCRVFCCARSTGHWSNTGPDYAGRSCEVHRKVCNRLRARRGYGLCRAKFWAPYVLEFGPALPKAAIHGGNLG